MDEEPCRRVITKAQLLKGLKAGRVACVDRRDAPELQDLLEMQEKGMVKSTLLQGDQYSVAKFWWNPDYKEPE